MANETHASLSSGVHDCRREGRIPAQLSVLFLLLTIAVAGGLIPRDAQAQQQNPPETLCNGLDDDEDGTVDDGFELGVECSVESGLCATAGLTVCASDGTSTVCEPNGPPLMSMPEQLNCFDGVDNDCNGLIDHEEAVCQTAELCDGFDNNGDGQVDEDFGLGAPCQAGVGTCSRSGSIVCAAGGGTTCSVSPGPPGVERGPGGPRCTDGRDNDCDGAVDLADSDCQSAEVCDGTDNDGDSEIDEGFDLGTECAVGVGACSAAGVNLCSATGLGVSCSATPGLASPEGPAGSTCSDGIDNDCDGLTDLDDPNCNASLSFVTCSLPFVRGRTGHDCTGWHRVNFSASGFGPDAAVRAEILQLDVDGSILGAVPVENGDLAHLASRTSPRDWRIRSRRGRHDVFAPAPMLRVTASDGNVESTAYCSTIPFLDIVSPAGGVVSASDGDETQVVVSIPQVQPSSLALRVDGVDVIAGLGLDPAVDFPGGPYSGAVVIGSELVSVSNLIVDAQPLDAESANTLRLTLENLGAGSHLILADGEPLAGQPGIRPTDLCLVDDVEDTDSVAIFGIEVDSPTRGQVTDAVPTPVVGRVLHGRPIESLQVNGLDLDVSSQVLIPGDGVSSADLYELAFSTALPQTDLAAEIANTTTQLGSFDPGANRLVVRADDEAGNRTFATRQFAVTPGDFDVAGTEFSAVRLAAAQKSRGIVQDAVRAAVSTEIQNAFVLGMEESAMDAFFASSCQEATATVEQNIREQLAQVELPSRRVSGGLSCDPTVYFDIPSSSVQVIGNLGCDVDLDDGFLTVSVDVPSVQFSVESRGSCRTTFLGACISQTIVDMDAEVTLTGLGVDFDITEAQFQSATSSTGSLVPGTETIEVTKDQNAINCLAGVVGDVLNFLVNLFTFFQGDFDLTPSFEGALVEVDLTESLGIVDFQLAAREVMINEREVSETMKTLSADLSGVRIRPGGLTVLLDGAFSPTSDDPEVEQTPGSLFTPAEPPMPPVSGPDNTFFVISDDALNQLFASMTSQGELKTTCSASGVRFGDLFPEDCATLNPGLQGLCFGIQETDCETIEGFVDQGVCHATRGESCESIPVSSSALLAEVEREACRATPFFNLFGDMDLLYCGRADVPPSLLIQDDSGTPTVVESWLRMNDLLVGLVVDRDGDALDGDLSALPACFQTGVGTTEDCRLVATCLDVNFPLALALDTSTGSPQITAQAGTPQFPPRPEGAICDGGVNFGGDSNTLSSAADSDSIDELMGNVDVFTPPLQSDGLDLGGIVTFSNPRMIAIDTSGGIAGFQDYLGITGTIVESP